MAVSDPMVALRGVLAMVAALMTALSMAFSPGGAPETATDDSDAALSTISSPTYIPSATTSSTAPTEQPSAAPTTNQPPAVTPTSAPVAAPVQTVAPAPTATQSAPAALAPAAVAPEALAPAPAAPGGAAAPAQGVGEGEVCDTSDGCLDRLSVSSGAKLPYYYSHSLNGSSTVTQAVVVLHGKGTNAQEYFAGMAAATADAGAEQSTAIITPWFQLDEDSPAEGDVYWTNSGDTSWKIGGESASPGGLSSFEAMDVILRMLGDKSRFPNLTRVTLAGHSAGGQFVQRYAAAGQAPDELPGITVTYVTANPSSYVYLDPERPVDPGSCAGFNDYKYGLDNRTGYMGALTEQQIRDRYTSRKVVYLLGSEDVELGGSLDDDCGAQAQGENRLERGKAYSEYIKRQYPSAPHQYVEVPGVGHDNAAMFGSEQGKAAIFGQ